MVLKAWGGGVVCRKKPKTLSGIETMKNTAVWQIAIAGKNLKPYQGLKQPNLKNKHNTNTQAGKNLKPYQGLKPKAARQRKSKN